VEFRLGDERLPKFAIFSHYDHLEPLRSQPGMQCREESGICLRDISFPRRALEPMPGRPEHAVPPDVANLCPDHQTILAPR